ncbi:flagellar hook-basal body complex protein [Sulfurospirillum sp. 1612]|uniref:flagellar hook-basal body complex protein n=1 Tax=Sulfurospirillum sp. 1612 TaxID=3094835 RepID=UPI002F92F2FE
MMRSLWAGVSGLQAHQVAMDVEGNNIANVNTAGFKYSRVNFSDLLSQTSQIATAPQGELGGQNPTQVGLGTQVSSITKIFKQGSVETTDKNTDLAIQNDGFFVVSPDGGKTDKFTRNGDFVFDADGNFVDSNGYIVQGWLQDTDTKQIDTNAPIQNITIDPGMTTPANPTSSVTIKANLNSGPSVTNKSLIYQLDSTGANTDGNKEVAAGAPSALDVGTLFDETGTSLALKDGDNFSLIFDNGTPVTTTFTYGTGAGDFQTTEDLRSQIQAAISAQSTGATATVNSSGKFEITNPTGGSSLQVSVVAGSQNNQNLLDIMSPLQGTIPADGSTKITQSLYSATHSSSIDIYDSLGTKHTLQTNFRKISQDSSNSTWEMVISVPDPGEISTLAPKNYLATQITFNSDGSLATPSSLSINYTGNNGSTGNQTISLQMGTSNQFDGMTSFDATSSTTNLTQDGYTGGNLTGIKIDETGTLIGSFSNGRSFGLAQVAMASFANNQGLESVGNGTYIQTSNSGDPIIGQANTGTRGSVQASSLEMSNVDLSRSLTQLIVVQRGFQANSKTITTSDQMLQTLLQLKS